MTTTIENIAPDATKVALGGYSPVSYFEKRKPERGSDRFAVEHDGQTYHLASPEQVKSFKANPAKFVPSFGGWCAYGMSMGKEFPVDPTSFKIVDDRLLVFLRNDEVDAHALWNGEDETDILDKARKAWESR